MDSIEQLIGEVEQFQSNIKDMSLLLTAIKRIHDDYEESINSPKILLNKIDIMRESHQEEYKRLRDDEKQIIETAKSTNRRIEESIDRQILLNEENKQLSRLMQDLIKQYNFSVDKYEDINRKLLKDVNQVNSDLVIHLDKCISKLQVISASYPNPLTIETMQNSILDMGIQVTKSKKGNKWAAVFGVINIVISLIIIILLVLHII